MRFYVYELMHEGQSIYIGKGSGNRLTVQMAAFGVEGSILSRFRRERDAYAFEVQAIAERSPWLNVRRGGNGSRATPKPPYRKTAGERFMDHIGTRRYAARLCLNFPNYFNPKTLEDIKFVALHGVTPHEMKIALQYQPLRI